MQEFEFHQEVVPIGPQLDVLKAAAKDGWEFIGMAGVPVTTSPLDPNTKPGLLMFFKRPKSANGDAHQLPESRKLFTGG